MRVSVLFSEPKIPQTKRELVKTAAKMRFQCSSASRKFLKFIAFSACARVARVSVLFSEPKIPQTWGLGAERRLGIRFQCSSASRKFLKRLEIGKPVRHNRRFSALQRAENSSKSGRYVQGTHQQLVSVLFSEPKIPQSQRTVGAKIDYRQVSVLFSEPKIPQNTRLSIAFATSRVSVLFSEPKIPQTRRTRTTTRGRSLRFSALQRAENSSKEGNNQRAEPVPIVSVLFSEPKIPQTRAISAGVYHERSRFSALQRAENSSNSARGAASRGAACGSFSALQRAENSSKNRTRCST